MSRHITIGETVHAQLKQYDEALEDYDNALNIDPDHQRAIHNRAYALALKESEGYQKTFEAARDEYTDREKGYQKNCRALRWHIRIMLLIVVGVFIFFFQDYLPGYLLGSKSITDMQPLTASSLLAISFAFSFPVIWYVIICLRSEKNLHALMEDAFTKRQVIDLMLSKPVENDKDRARLVEKFIEFLDKRATADIVMGTKTPSVPQQEIGESIVNRLREIINLKDTK